MASVTTVERAPFAHASVRLRHHALAALRWAVQEGVLLFTVLFAFYVAVGAYLVFTVNYLPGDAIARVANAYYVLFSRDPHLAAIGFVWEPLPSFLDLPLLALKGWFPELASRAFAGCIESAAFAAGTAALINAALRRAQVGRPLRWLLLATYALNPMIVLYAANGMSESMLIFFMVASVTQFMRWARTPTYSSLVALGVIAGLGTFVRYEMIPFAAAMGGAVVVMSLRRGVRWRELETAICVYALPVVFSVLLWIALNAVIMHDPLFFIHSQYLAAQGARQSSALAHFPAAQSFLAQILWRLFPALVVVAGLTLVTCARRWRNWRTAAGLVMATSAILLFHLYLIQSDQSQLWLRFYITAIPAAFLLLIYVLGELRQRIPRIGLGLLMLPVFGFSGLMSGRAMADPAVAAEGEYGVVAAVRTGGQVHTYVDLVQAKQMSAEIAAIDQDGSLIATDTVSTFPLILTARDPRLFVIVNDEDFQAAISAPQLYHVGYFLVPSSASYGTVDAIERQYPSLYANGAGFATLVKEFSDKSRLYRITASTGR